MKRTRTSSFGSPGRTSHESSSFYKSRLYHGVKKEDKVVEFSENPIRKELLDRVFCKSSEAMDELPDDSVHLMVTSPPYNVGKEYDRDLTLEEYRNFLMKVWAEVKRVLVPGGPVLHQRRQPREKTVHPVTPLVIDDMSSLGFLMRGEIIWAKEASSSSSTAWGSWMSASNPTLRDTHEYILVFSKGSFAREAAGRKSTIERAEFLEFTKSVWRFDAGTGEEGGASCAVPGHAALSLHAALLVRGRRRPRPVHGLRTDRDRSKDDGQALHWV